MSNIHLSVTEEFKVSEPYCIDSILNGEQDGDNAAYSILHGIVELTRSGHYTFLSIGTRTVVGVQGNPPKMGVRDSCSFEGWKRHPGSAEKIKNSLASFRNLRSGQYGMVSTRVSN
ncbi:MAG: hypothetical protein F4X56_01105 [Gammaproteobacteria bacterium]|nr:hypothetical protein [Gammaproteobacteria bacterium]MYC24499.1 hypothetical protein [Gammaproteobacteria bacterium]